MKRFAVISDIHGNLEALEAVFARIEKLNVESIICLGDIVGYGPHPAECLNMVVRHCSTIVGGNHELGVVDPQVAESFNGAARDALNWTRRNVTPLHMDAITRFPLTARVGDEVTCVHDSPVPGPTDYIHNASMAALAFSGIDTPICLLGHTHVPVVFEAPLFADGRRLSADDVTPQPLKNGGAVMFSPGRRYICNPGSVGQPRDADPRASFAILDLSDRSFTLHRQEYDIDTQQLASYRAGLPMILAERLAIGA